jgi:transposase
MPYRIAGIDVHKKMLAIAVADVEIEGDVHFERLKVGTSPVQLRALAEWLVEREVEEVVMESTAQYWRPVWEALERYWRPTRRTRADASPVSGTLHLAQAQSNRGAGGRKRDFPDAERLVKRLVAQELTLSFVPDAEQRLWRTVMRRKYQITRSRVQLHNRLEALLEEAHIKISSVVSDLLGTSARRMLHAVGDGETDPAVLASLADQRLRATPEQLRDAFGACADLHPVYRRLVKLTLDELRRSKTTSPNSINRWRSCSLSTTIPCNAWLKCQVWASIPRSRSSRKSVPVPPRFRQRNSSRPGWARVRATRRVPASITVIAAPKAIVRCDESSIRPPTPQ